MSILEKYSAAMKNKDEAAMNELLHDDFKFTMHKSGNTLSKGDVIKWAMSGVFQLHYFRKQFLFYLV